MRGTPIVLAVLLVASALAGCAAPEPEPAEDRSLIETLDQATAWIDTPEEARAAGYRPAPYCLPGEGVPWLDQSAVDTRIEPHHPEIVRFLPTTSNLTDDDRQRFVGVEYVAITEGTAHNTTQNPPQVLGVAMEGPLPGSGPGEPWHAVLPVMLVDEAADPFTDRVESLTCPPGTTPQGIDQPASSASRSGPVDAHQLPACARMTDRTVHDHAELVLYLDDARDPVDLSPERYQLAASQVHVERGQRDADGATVHVHADGTTIGCFLATLGWSVSEEAIITDTGEVYAEDAHHRIEVHVDGQRAGTGLATEMEHDTRYVVSFDDTSDPTAA